MPPKRLRPDRPTRAIKDIVLILYESIEARKSPDWSVVAYIGPSQSAEEAVARVTSKIRASKRGEAARGLVTFMNRMQTQQSPADALLPDGK
jgi:hypothetical protein